MSADLRTRYLGLELRSPIVASAAPGNADLAHAVRLEQAGVGAIVLPSLFEDEVVHEQVGLSAALDHGTGQFAEASGYFPAVDRFTDAAERYARPSCGSRAGRPSRSSAASTRARRGAGSATPG